MYFVILGSKLAQNKKKMVFHENYTFNYETNNNNDDNNNNNNFSVLNVKLNGN